MKTLLAVIFVFVLLAIGAITAASEISMVAVSRLRLRRLALDGSKAAKIILKIMKAPEKFFGTILVANNIVGVLIASIVTAMMVSSLGGGGKIVLAAIVVVSFLIIVSEVVAKTFAARYSERLSLALAMPVRLLVLILSPLVKIFAAITDFIIRAFGPEVKDKAGLVTEEEVRAFIKISEEEDIKHKEKYRMLSKVFDFSETIVRSVMTPKKNIFSVRIDDDINLILERALESGYSRIPVYKDSPDNIIGIINMKDLLNLSLNRGILVLNDIIFSPLVVPGTKKVTDLLKEFKKGGAHIAIVIDDKNRLEGLVTLEDLLEEIVGEIEDEYDIRIAVKK